MRATLFAPVLISVLIASNAPVPAEDWPEWRGAGRRGVWTETDTLERFPPGGLSYTWRTPVGEGYSGPAVSAGRVFVTDFERSSGIRGTERTLCLDEKSGAVLWKHGWKVDYTGTEPRWASGPRATPTVDGDRVYVAGGMGMLWALDTRTGKPAWQHDLVAEYAAAIPTWGVASAPIVVDGLLIALVGGEDGATVVAFDKRTGVEEWRALSASGDPGYAPPVIVESGGQRQLIVWHPKAIHSLDPRTGESYWSQPFEVRMGMTVATPVIDRDRLLVSAFFDGAMLLKLDPGNGQPSARLVWHRKGASEQPSESRGLHALITTPVLDGDHVYGIGSYGELRGLSAASGERVWETLDLVRERKRWAAGLIVQNGDRYLVNNDRGELVLARFTPKGYEEIDRTDLIAPTSQGGGRRELDAVHWSHPAYANRHIVVRNDREIVRASLAASARTAPGDPQPTE